MICRTNSIGSVTNLGGINDKDVAVHGPTAINMRQADTTRENQVRSEACFKAKDQAGSVSTELGRVGIAVFHQEPDADIQPPLKRVTDIG